MCLICVPRYVSHDSFICETQLIVGWSSSQTTHRCVCTTCCEQLIHMCTMTQADAGIFVASTSCSASPSHRRPSACRTETKSNRGCSGLTRGRPSFRSALGSCRITLMRCSETLTWARCRCQLGPSTGPDFNSTSGSDKTAFPLQACWVLRDGVIENNILHVILQWTISITLVHSTYPTDPTRNGYYDF